MWRLRDVVNMVKVDMFLAGFTMLSENAALFDKINSGAISTPMSLLCCLRLLVAVFAPPPCLPRETGLRHFD